MSAYNDAAVIAKVYNKAFLENYDYYYFPYNILIGTILLKRKKTANDKQLDEIFFFLVLITN